MTTNWNIIQLKRNPNNGLVFEVIYIMNFELDGETDRKVSVLGLEGNVNSPNFIPFENLTQQNVLDWIQTTLGEATITQIEAEVKERLEERIDRKNNPEFLTGKPWENSLNPHSEE